MTRQYKDNLLNILLGVRPRLATTHSLEFKNSFGAVAGYLDGNIFIVNGKFGLALKLPPKTIEKLFHEKDAFPFRYFKKGHVKKDYSLISRCILNDKVQLKKLINKSIKFTLT